VSVASNLQRLFIDDLDVDVVLVETLKVAIYLPPLLNLVDLELGTKCALSLKLSLAVGFAQCLAMRLNLCLAL
jgi:hypothetical protein